MNYWNLKIELLSYYYNIEYYYIIVTSIRFQDSLCIFLKWMQLQSGQGDFGQVCLLVAVPGMPEGSYFYQTIPGSHCQWIDILCTNALHEGQKIF